MNRPVRPCLAVLLFLPLILAAGAAWAQYDDPPGDDEPPVGSCPASATRVNLSGMSFSPSTLTVQAGTTVCWQNEGGEHSVRSNTGVFDSGDPSSARWYYTYTFNTPGTYPYYCIVHGSPSSGMRGTIIVQGSGSGDSPGVLRFSQTGYGVSEGAGSATIAVSRVSGDNGAVSVTWTASAGTAAAGSDFTAGTGTVSWADGDDSNKTFTVPILNDSAAEGNETVSLALSGPTGGAALDAARRNATLTITDNDSPPPAGTPAAPANLQAQAVSTTEIQLNWTDASSNETGFRIERRTLTGAYEEIGSVAANTRTFSAQGLTAGTFYLFRVRASGGGGTFSGYSNEVATATSAVPAPCLPGATTLCLNNGRFQVEAEWRTASVNGNGFAVELPSAPDSGLFYFFAAQNIEMLVKVLNACAGTNPRYWVFFAATTNVELALTVTDTQTGRTKAYFNPLGRPAPPVQDTGAFATCP